MFSEKLFDTGEVAIHYVEYPAPGPPLLLLHGLTSTWENHWASIIPRLTPDWHVFACDFRGHGKSGKVANQYQFVDYARDTAALLRGCVDAPAVLMGHSLGALAALIVAAQAPELARAVVLLDPPLFLRSRPMSAVVGAHFWFTFVYKTLKSSPTYEAVLARCRAVQPEADEAVIRAQAGQIFALDIGTVATALYDRVLTDDNLEAWLRGVTCPALLMRGDWEHGAALDDADAAFVRERLPHVVDVKLAGADHSFPLEQTERTLAQVKTFLAAV
jgi:pimeloyl-ACP methyl ester carboxylesterase